MADEDQPATKRDLRRGLAELGAELRGELATKAELRKLGEDLRAELATKVELRDMERRLVTELSGVVQRAMNIAVEQIRSKIAVVDEKYKDLPGRVAVLERDVAELKARPPAP